MNRKDIRVRIDDKIDCTLKKRRGMMSLLRDDK